MKKLLIAFALAAALPLSGCASYNLAEPPLAQTTVDEKALYVAETAFAAASEVIEAGIDGGLIYGERAEKVDVLYSKAKGALDLAREAQLKGDTGTIIEQAAIVQTVVAQLFTLVQ